MLGNLLLTFGANYFKGKAPISAVKDSPAMGSSNIPSICSTIF